jgi:hypothetical protein
VRGQFCTAKELCIDGIGDSSHFLLPLAAAAAYAMLGFRHPVEFHIQLKEKISAACALTGSTRGLFPSCDPLCVSAAAFLGFFLETELSFAATASFNSSSVSSSLCLQLPEARLSNSSPSCWPCARLHKLTLSASALTLSQPISLPTHPRQRICLLCLFFGTSQLTR